jgi:hypothetical protein
MYTYVHQNPWTHFDPEGLEEQYKSPVLNFIGPSPVLVTTALQTVNYAKNPQNPAGMRVAAAMVAGVYAVGIALDVAGPGGKAMKVEKVVAKVGEEVAEKVVENTAKTVAKDAEKKGVADLEKKAAAAKPPTSGETAATKQGREEHKTWDPGEGFKKEVATPSGKRADAVNTKIKEVKELKPDNPRAIKRGEKQVEGYRKEFQKEHGGHWTGKVETYKPKKP